MDFARRARRVRRAAANSASSPGINAMPFFILHSSFFILLPEEPGNNHHALAVKIHQHIPIPAADAFAAGGMDGLAGMFFKKGGGLLVAEVGVLRVLHHLESTKFHSIRKAEGGGQRAEGRGQRTEDRGQRAEDRGQRTEDRG